jgi:signal transduction histidine kinase
MSNRNRGKFLVDSRVQLSLVGRVIVHWISFIVLFLLVVLTIEMFLREPGVSVLDSLSISLKKNALMFVLMVAVLPAFLYDTVKMSNRFAGPISRLKYGLTSLANGQPVEKINFRKGDFWGELAEDFNRVATRLEAETEIAQENTPVENSETPCRVS